MARTVFHAWNPQRRRAKQHIMVLNLPRCHTSPVGTSKADATPTSDHKRSVSSSRVAGELKDAILRLGPLIST